MEGDSPAQLPIAQTTQAQAPPGQPVISQQQVPPGQPIMYQMQPGQQQPVFVQVPAGQPATTPDGQPIQYYYVPVTQPMQPGQQGQPVQPVHPGQPVQPGQTVYVQGAPSQQVQPQQQAGQGLDFTIDTDFLKSPLCYIKIAEFVSTAFPFTAMFRFWRSSRARKKRSTESPITPMTLHIIQLDLRTFGVRRWVMQKTGLTLTIGYFCVSVV